MKRPDIDQRRQVERERRAFIEEVSQEQATIRAHRKQYPVGSMFMWALGEGRLGSMFGPPGSARKIETATDEGEQAA